MKFNWGTAIAIFYISFMAVMIFFVIQSKTYDHSLVVDNYYEEDLKYQQHYDQISNSMADEKSFQYKYQPKENLFNIEFPNQIGGVEGRIVFYRPSNSRLDFEVPIELNTDNKMEISTKNLATGKWRVKCNWTVGKKDFYKEVDLYL